MTTRPPAPGDPGLPGRPGRPGSEPDQPDQPDPQRAKIAALWTLVLDRFRDYLHWATMVTDDPCPQLGGPHDPDA